MKKLLIFMTGLFLLSCNNEKAKEAENKIKYRDLSIEMLKGDIQSYTETAYKTDASGKLGEMDSCCADLIEYDENGNATSYNSKNSSGTIKNASVYSRLENGLWTGSTDSKEGGKPSGSMKVSVNEKGQYTIAQTYDSTGKPDIYYSTTGQNEYGQVQAWKQYDKDSVFRQEWESTYEKNLLVSATTKDSVGNVKQRYVAKYNDKGELIENSNTEITKDSTTVKVKKFTYETHDDLGNWTQRTEWDDKGKAIKILKRTYVYRKPS
jgi:hypothetical protein